MQFIDTHIHLQDFKADFAPQVWQNREARKLVLIAAQGADFAKIANLVRKYPDKAVGAFGVHPWYCDDIGSVDKLNDYLWEFPRALVGEIGVDGLKEMPTAAQHQLFSRQLAAAKDFNRPVVIHAAKAFVALQEHKSELKEVKFVYHSFVKNRELIKFVMQCGGYFGLGALFLRQEKVAELWKEMPKDRILFETDAPYQFIENGYNAAVQDNLARLAEIAGLSLAELEELLLRNTEEFLKC